MKTIAEHTGRLLCFEFFTNASFSVLVHCHQWRKWLWEDGKRPPDSSAFDFLGKGIDDPLSVSWLEDCVFSK